jgi:hypothetical protein
MVLVEMELLELVVVAMRVVVMEEMAETAVEQLDYV